MTEYSNNLKLAFAKPAEGLLDVRHFSVHEGMNDLFEVSVLAVSTEDDIDLTDFVGKAASLTVHTPNRLAGTPMRAWAGICAQMSQVHAEPFPGKSAYHVLIVPLLWRTTLRRNSRIFQHLTTPEIVKKLLDEWGIKPIDKLDKDPKAYKKHEYCVQYGESDYAFICRLLEEAGISFYFESVGTSGKVEDITKLVLHDAPQKNEQKSGKLSYAGHQVPAFGGSEDFCATVTLTHRVRPGRYALRDYDFRRRPDSLLKGEAKWVGGHAPEEPYEIYEYAPGVFLREFAAGDKPADVQKKDTADKMGVTVADAQHSKETATREGDADRQRRLLVSFHTNALDMAPGKVIAINQRSTFANHPRADLSPEQKLLVIESSFEGEHNGEWSMRASAVYAEFNHRPERRTPKPRIFGVQSALVVGPPGQEIHTDEFGRVRVQFHWDREGKYNPDDKDDSPASCWMRVSQPWAGGGFGLINLPRVGHEVLVEFFEGDPDLPVIIGRVFNATTNVPYKLPENKTQSGWKTATSPGGEGHNEIMFEDKKGRELIHAQAQKDLSVVVKHNESRDVGSNRTTTIGAADALAVDASRSVTVGGNHTLDVDADRTIKVKKADATHVGDLHTVSVGPHTGSIMKSDGTIILSNSKATLAFSPDGTIQLVGPNTTLQMISDGNIVLTNGKATIQLTPDGGIFQNATDVMAIHAGKDLDITSQSGTILIQGGPMVRINEEGAGKAPQAAPNAKPSPIGPALPPAAPGKPDPGQGGPGAPFLPAGGGTIDKPHGIGEDLAGGGHKG